jgi:hypothetical protein
VGRYRAGTLEAPGELADLLVLGDLLDEDDPYRRRLTVDEEGV